MELRTQPASAECSPESKREEGERDSVVTAVAKKVLDDCGLGGQLIEPYTQYVRHYVLSGPSPRLFCIMCAWTLWAHLGKSDLSS